MGSGRPRAHQGRRRGAQGKWKAGAALALLALAGLSGCQSADRGAADRAAAQQAYKVSDSGVRAEIERRWKEAGGIDDRLDVTVTGGRALLTGNAKDPDQRVEAVRLAWQVEGVQEVINEVQVGDSSGLSDTATDLWIATQLRSKLLFDSEISSKNYTIEVVNQTVYLLGRARSPQELERVQGYAREIGRVRRVVNHVRM